MSNLSAGSCCSFVWHTSATHTRDTCMSQASLAGGFRACLASTPTSVVREHDFRSRCMYFTLLCQLHQKLPCRHHSFAIPCSPARFAISSRLKALTTTTPQQLTSCEHRLTSKSSSFHCRLQTWPTLLQQPATSKSPTTLHKRQNKVSCAST
jgi:hypothetical protein